MDRRIADAAASCEAAVEAQRAIASLTAAIGRPLEASAAAVFTAPAPARGRIVANTGFRGRNPTLAALTETPMTSLKSIFALAAVCGALAGCTSAGQLTPTASAAINTAYNDVCNALPALGPASATMNADAKNAYAQAQTICAAGAPGNAVAAGVDILAIENALLPYFKKATALASNQEVAKLRAKFATLNLRNLRFGE
jgi:hypothetical protein